MFADAPGKLEERIAHVPLGVIANISAWNYPYFVGGNVFVPALAAGNAVLYKPSEFATLTGQHIADLLHEAGVPRNVFIAVIGDGKTGAALLRQPVDGVFFTGSYGTGAKIAASTGRRMIKTQLELGGKDPVYVCEDVDVKSAAAGLADGAFYNTGQSCCSVERIYIHEAVYDAFVAAFVAEVKSFKIGDPLDETTYVGAITRKPQIAVLGKQVADAKRKGAKLLLGGHVLKGKGNWFAPTVFADADHSMLLMREESFGPIIGLQAVADDEAAVELMNDTEYGLTAGVYSASEKRAKKHPGAGAGGKRLLELLRPRESAPAVVRRQAFGHRTHAIHLRHPDVHAAEGLAPARSLERQVGSSVALTRSCHCAARSVFASSVAIVIGPTPPGTGVIQPATSFAASKSTSPQSLPSGRRLMPTSMTIAPGLIQSPGTNLRLADTRHHDVALPHDARQIARGRVADRHGAARHQQLQRHRPADDVRLADDHRVLADQVLAGLLEETHAAERRARAQRWASSAPAGRRCTDGSRRHPSWGRCAR